jgi:hypothetical protein
MLNPFFALSEMGFNFLRDNMGTESQGVRSTIGPFLQDLAQRSVNQIQSSTRDRIQ